MVSVRSSHRLEFVRTGGSKGRFSPNSLEVGRSHSRMYRSGEKTVLVVDDDIGVQGLIRHTLESVGYRVEAAQGSEEALRLWRDRFYGLVITDLVLASSGGVDLIREIRSDDQQVPILAITGFGQEVAQEALDAGADHLLRKPFHLFELRELIRRLMA